MSYTGEVTPGGAPDVRELSALTITKVAVDDKMSNNCYLLTCRSTGDQVLIDAADSAETLLPLIGDAGLSAVVARRIIVPVSPRARRPALAIWACRRRAGVASWGARRTGGLRVASHESRVPRVIPRTGSGRLRERRGHYEND